MPNRLPFPVSAHTSRPLPSSPYFPEPLKPRIVADFVPSTIAVLAQGLPASSQESQTLIATISYLALLYLYQRSISGGGYLAGSVLCAMSLQIPITDIQDTSNLITSPLIIPTPA